METLRVINGRAEKDGPRLLLKNKKTEKFVEIKISEETWERLNEEWSHWFVAALSR